MAYSSVIAQSLAAFGDRAAEVNEPREAVCRAATDEVRALTLFSVPEHIAQASTILCSARLAHALQHRLVLDAWSVGAIEANAGTIALAFPTGIVRTVVDLAGYPSLWLAARRVPQLSSTDGQSLQVSIASALLVQLCAQLEKLGIGPFRVTDLALGTDLALTTENSGVYFAFSFSVDGNRINAQAGFHSPTPIMLDELFKSGGVSAAPLAALTIPGRLILGRRRLSIAQLNRLSTGDILLRALAHEATPLAKNEPGAIAVAAWGTPSLTRWHGRVEIKDASLLIIDEIRMNQESESSSFDDNLATQDPLVDVGQLDLPVQFEVDTIAMSIAQISALRPGHVLKLPKSVSNAQIKMIAHGQTIGFGELVTVGEHLGVRIVRMAHNDGSAQ